MIVWGLWFVHLFISTLFIAGMVVAYNRVWQLAFRGNLPEKGAQRVAARVLLSLTPVAIAGMLEFASYADPISWATYTNIELFVLVYPLLDEEINGWEYTLRALVAGGFWLWQHDMADPYARAMALAMLLLFVVIWPFREKIHYNWWLDTPLALFLAFAFWHAQSRITGVLEFGPIMTFMIMNQFTFAYWTGVHLQDVSKRELELRANYDALTNARSYSLFQQDVTSGFARAQEEDVPLTIVMLDIDHFKDVNDHYGHLAGNAVLIGVATLLDTVLKAEFGEAHQLYRTGGEEFNIIFVGKSIETIMPVIERCWREVRGKTFAYDNQQIRVTISVGVTAMRADDQKVDDVYKRADENLYRSKRAGRDTITVEGNTLRFAEERGAALTYTYFAQPIVRARDRVVIQHELLLRVFDKQQDRWRLPDRFDIPVDTQVNLIRRVLGQTGASTLSLNLTAAQFADEDVAYALVEFMMNEPRLQALTVDVTALPAAEITRNVCAIYHSGGIKVAIDDVGDANSLSAVMAVIREVDGIKMTLRLLVTTMPPVQAQAAVASWQSIADDYGKTLTLEGIESEQQERLAIAAGVTRLQGYYYGQPVMP